MEWDVKVTLKSGRTSEYVYEGKREDARMDAYLVFPRGEIAQVEVNESTEDEE